MQQYDRAATMPLPPMFPADVLPQDLYSREELDIVRDWLKATQRCRGVEEFEKAAKSWRDEARAEVARILAELRARGFFPDRVDENGQIVWGVMLKGAVQVRYERNAEHWLNRGQEIRERGFEYMGAIVHGNQSANEMRGNQ